MHTELELRTLIGIAKLLQRDPKLIGYGPLIPVGAAFVYVYEVPCLSCS